MASIDRAHDDVDLDGHAAGRGGLLDHFLIDALGILAGVLVIVAGNAWLPDWAATMLLDRGRSTWPVTVQNIQWLIFGLGVGELLVRTREARAERAQLRRGLLPEDESTILQAPDLRRIYAGARGALRERRPPRLLPRLIHRVVVQFQTNRKVDQASTILNSTLELFQHEIDLRYTLVRYVIWAIPTLGFLGTVLGISLALNYAGTADLRDPRLLADLTRHMAVAFDTTLLALSMSSVLVLHQHLVQRYEEEALNAVGQYCLDNLINRLFTE
ncbi:MotA/TolQ/ExbB proton channel family protein [Arenibaculum pallidiluteum]|uniref:MotA/TolQ/ExbB proton channel family protein n=1 Tax=Arenibaculum pallidiluteum TaxID=2812559 RepID=UPI001A95CF56|nr:MotA/TolQ/ExbB proton channel family protein [Arenibaculum pallidiluteum]